ncbi:type 1 glutamine amidotransferase domain-containing protein [Saccharicrinis fermentans]|uniref:General stress protein 18 n=1 Tax=Saccharicrinis fermentans DSM 9555 = JCM 21142 TaxID=869213 RepID=W7Y422_9BACT|nr:type 1 glutamine amidotransferase domain-containing protein [Saccharicrinis fermentans]GAF02323.1 general stress protein 18 [Saccharicrinis fermentans DSM 9555 = JCM 21142]
MKKISIVVLVFALFSSCNSGSKGSKVTEQEASTKSESNTTIKNVLFVLTSHDELGNTGHKTGFWIEEFATPYYFLKDHGVKITIASPKGGQPPIDPRSSSPDSQTPATVRFNEDKETQEILSKTQKLETINQADYDAVFYPGGHGPLWDLAEDKNSIELIQAFYANNKPVGAVCHGPAIFKNTKNADGTFLVEGKKVTGFSNSEEDAVQLSNIVPFLVEDMLKENGGVYTKGENWTPYAVEDGLLITGQNPASSELVAELLFKRLFSESN